MRRFVVLICAQALVLVLFGCSSGQQTSLDPSSERAFAAGALLEMDNGLALTIPAGWTATLYTYSEPSGDLQATQKMVAERAGEADGMSLLNVFSSGATTLPVAAIDQYGHDEFVPAGSADHVDFLLGQPDRGFAPNRLIAARTSVPGAQLGLVLFAGNPEDPRGAFRGVCRLFGIQGLPQTQ